MAKFKIGDKVRIIKTRVAGYGDIPPVELGAICNVESVGAYGNPASIVIRRAGRTSSWYARWHVREENIAHASVVRMCEEGIVL